MKRARVQREVTPSESTASVGAAPLPRPLLAHEVLGWILGRPLPPPLADGAAPLPDGAARGTE
jgi:hypothetical protein